MANSLQPVAFKINGLLQGRKFVEDLQVAGILTFNTGFDLEKECTKLDEDCLSKLAKLQEMGKNNKKRNFLKLNIYKWDVEDTIEFYENDKFCWDYCIDKTCNNEEKCEFIHDPEMTFDELYNKAILEEDWMYMAHCCEYLVSAAQYSNNSNLYFYYGMAHCKLCNDDISRSLFLKSIEINSNNARAHRMYANILFKMRHFDKAKLHYQKAIDLLPYSASVYASMANFLLKMGDYKGSLMYSQKAAILSENYEYTLVIAESYYHLKQRLLAKSYYEKTKQLMNYCDNHGLMKLVVAARIQSIDQLWDTITNGMDMNDYDGAKLNNRNVQIKFILSCINSGMPFYQLSFIFNKFNLPGSLIKEAIDQLGATVVKEKENIENLENETENEDESQEVETTNVNLETFEQSVWKTIEWCFEVMSEIDKVKVKNGNDKNEDDDDYDDYKILGLFDDSNNIEPSTRNDWKHRVLERLIPNCSNTAPIATNDTGASAQNDEPLTADDYDVLSTIETAWEIDSSKLNTLSNNSDLDLSKYFETIELIESQEKRLKNELYSKVAQLNKSLFTNQVCVFTFCCWFYFLLCCKCG